MAGPLTGFRVVEFQGLGPAPLAGMLLADMGADVIIIERASGGSENDLKEITRRNKRSIALNLKSDEGKAIAKDLIARADVLIEGFRPGVMERLGLGPDECLALKPQLVYGRMTGWGQTGPLAHAAGHDMNYISLTGALHAIGRKDEPPTPPLNLVGDFGGGTMFLVTGILAALLEAGRSGQGQVIDAAMTDGSAMLMTFMHSQHAQNNWDPTQRESNMLDGGAHFYTTYETKDGLHVSFAPIEPQFYAEFFQRIGVDAKEFEHQNDKAYWPQYRARLAEIFRQKTRTEWCELLEGTDACFAPILNFEEARHHPHNQARETYIEVNGQVQPAPAPRFSRTAPATPRAGTLPGAETDEVLGELGLSADRIAELRAARALT
jgi:alpha-methylacyl-CoA racemase